MNMQIGEYLNSTHQVGLINKVSELRTTTHDGTPYFRFTLMTMFDHLDSVKPVCHNCYFFGKKAEELVHEFKMGMMVEIKGSINYAHSKDPDGRSRQMAQIVCGEYKILNPANDFLRNRNEVLEMTRREVPEELQSKVKAAKMKVVSKEFKVFADFFRGHK